MALVEGGRLISDTLLAFYNRGTCEVWVAELDGTVRNRMGRCGRGPGDLSDFFGLWNWAGDSLLIADQVPPRLSVFSLDGGFGRTLPRSSIEGFPLAIPVGLVGDRIVMRNDQSPMPEPGIIPLHTVLVATDLDGGNPRRLGRYVSRTYEAYELAGRIVGRTLSFSGRSAFAVGPDRVFVGIPEDYRIEVFALDGSLRRIIRRAFDRIVVEDRHLEWLMERRLLEMETDDQRRAVRRAFRDLEHAEVMPAFGVPEWPGLPERAGPPMITDDAGNLWVFEHYEPGGYANDWTVFDSTGRWVANSTLPDGFIPTHIGADFILGQWTDDLGLTHLKMFELAKD